MILTNNNFKNNTASLGGGAIYFNNKLPMDSPYMKNNFYNNKADFANDFCTYPMRLRFTDMKGYDSLTKYSSYTLTVIPAITNLNFYFEIVDYYNQTIKSINGRLNLSN